MKIATWNINSIRARMESLLRWLQETAPDVVLLQETKCLEEQFPYEPIEDLGYNIAVFGQKSYNGVAILSKKPIEDVTKGLPGLESTEARYIEAVIGTVRVASIYVPNGQDIGTEKFAQKLAFFKALQSHMATLLSYGEQCVMGGDYNVAPTDADVYDPEKFQNRLLASPEERAGFQSLLNAGMVDALRARLPEVEARYTETQIKSDKRLQGPRDRSLQGVNEDPEVPQKSFGSFKNEARYYTWWDYRQGSFEKNHGLRIDHLLLSPQASDTLKSVGIDRDPRSWDKPSDHVPVWCHL